jgi:hypothetical protein
VMNAEERMDVIAAFREVGSYRGAAEICGTTHKGTTHKTVKRIVIAQQQGWPEGLEVRRSRPRNFDCVADLVAERVEKTQGRISAKRLLPKARAAGYVGSARNFRRLVARANGTGAAAITAAVVRGCGRRGRR